MSRKIGQELPPLGRDSRSLAAVTDGEGLDTGLALLPPLRQRRVEALHIAPTGPEISNSRDVALVF